MDDYTKFADKIYLKRYMSSYLQRKYIHHRIYESILKYIKPGMVVADIGAGEGVLSMLMAQRGALVTALEISKPNIVAAKKLAKEYQLSEKIKFIEGDASSIPFKDSSFDMVVSCHVLEHLPDFDIGLLELKRIAKQKIIVAVPTCFNWCAIPLLGGGNYWSLSIFTPIHILKGVIRILINIFSEGVNENYAGKQFVHIWRYPWVVINHIKKAKLKIIKIEASSLVPPYLLTYIPKLENHYKAIDKYTDMKILKYLGYGTTYYVEK